jgi:eukaryotic-like serine/threonine-protein kinase
VAQIQQDTMLGGRYRLLSRIASGGMGTVWRGVDVVLDRPVAVKTLSEAMGEDAKFVERFRREARAAAGLSHPNVAGVYDYGEDGATPFIVMELLDGETLAGRMARSGRIPPAGAAGIATRVAEALQAAHDAGVVHRDVKPGNVMLTEGGGVKVMDFGIAATAWAVPLTATGTTMGTASYLSPEQASGERATPASDVYALGCVLYEMLTGRAPFPGETPVAVATAHVQSRVVPVRQLAPDVPPSLAAACERALEKDPAARPPSARAFASMLAAGATGARSAAARGSIGSAATGTTQIPTPGAPTTPLRTEGVHPVPPAPAPRRRRTTWIGWAVVALLLALALAVALVAAFSGGKNPRRPPAGPSTPATRSTSPAAPTTGVVPSVVGLGLDEATARLVGAGLLPRVRVVHGDEGIVLGVLPEEGTSLNPGDSVTLFVGDGHQKKKDKGNNGNGGGGD